MNCFNLLPSELIMHICKQEQTVALKLRLSSKALREIIDKEGKQIKLVSNVDVIYTNFDLILEYSKIFTLRITYASKASAEQQLAKLSNLDFLLLYASNLPNLQLLSNVRELSLSNIDNLHFGALNGLNLTSLSLIDVCCIDLNLPKLQKLKIINVSKRTPFNITELHNLHTLSLVNSRFNKLPYLPNLLELHLNNETILEEDCLKYCTNLHILEIIKSNKIKIGNLSSLRCITISEQEAKFIRYSAELPNLVNLENLHLNLTTNNTNCIRVNLDRLVNLCSISLINISANVSKQNKIKYLTLSNCDINDLQHLSQLETLVLNTTYVKNLSTLHMLKNLTIYEHTSDLIIKRSNEEAMRIGVLSISNMINKIAENALYYEDLYKQIDTLDHLQNLYLYNSSIKSINIKNLNFITLSNCELIRDINNLKRLKSVNLHNCPLLNYCKK